MEMIEKALARAVKQVDDLLSESLEGIDQTMRNAEDLKVGISCKILLEILSPDRYGVKSQIKFVKH